MEWIDMNKKKPLTYEEGDWDGKRSERLAVRDEKGVPHAVRLYAGQMDGSEFYEFYDADGYEIIGVTHWLELPFYT